MLAISIYESAILLGLLGGVTGVSIVAPVTIVLLKNKNNKNKKNNEDKINDRNLKLKALEAEHKTNLDIMAREMQILVEDQKRLEQALNLLSELGLHIPEEYELKLSQYQSEHRHLEKEAMREDVLLKYLQNNILSVA